MISLTAFRRAITRQGLRAAALLVAAAGVLSVVPAAAQAGASPGTTGSCVTGSGFGVTPIYSSWQTGTTKKTSGEVRLYDVKIRRAATRVTMAGTQVRTVMWARVWARDKSGKWLRAKASSVTFTRRWLNMLFGYSDSTPLVPRNGKHPPKAKVEVGVRYNRSCKASLTR